MSRTGHFLAVVLFLVAVLAAAYVFKQVQGAPTAPMYEGFEALGGGAITGIVFGVLAFLGLAYYLYKRYRGSAAVAPAAYSGNYSRPNNRGPYNRGPNNRAAAY